MQVLSQYIYSVHLLFNTEYSVNTTETMGFGGSAQAMITIIKNNKNMLSKRKDRGISFVHTSTEKTEYDLPKSTPETIRRIREKTQKQNKRIFVKRVVALVVVIGCIISFLAYAI